MAFHPKLAANLSFLFKDRDFLDRFAAAAACGFKGVEFGAEVPSQWTIEQLVAAKESAGVEVVGLCTPLGDEPGDHGLAAIPRREADFKVALGTAIEYAKALKCPRIHALAGSLPVGVSSSHPIWKQAELVYISNLKYAAEECAKYDITLLIEPISLLSDAPATSQLFRCLQYKGRSDLSLAVRKVDHSTFRAQATGKLEGETENKANADGGIDVIYRVSHPNIKLEFDVFHAQIMDGNICEFFSKNVEDIGHIQIAQVPGRHEPDENGELNFPFLFKLLGLQNYKGWIGCEYQPRGKTEDGLGWAADYLKREEPA